MTRVAVVGHVEWVDFLRAEHLPAAGEIVAAQRAFMHAGGGAVVAAAVLAELGAEVDFFCALGDDQHGQEAVAQLERWGVTVHAARRQTGTREVITVLDRGGERTIVTIGERLQPRGEDPLPWELLEQAAGVYFTAGDLGALHRARMAGKLVATPRISERLAQVDVRLDALVYSADDATEQTWARPLLAHADLIVETEGAHGGRWSGISQGRWEPAAVPGPAVDSYGCGDSFAAGFTFGLATTGDPATAARIGAERGALMLTRTGAP